MKILLSFLLMTALSELVSALIRQHIYVKNEVNWFEAQTYCRTYYTDLSIISSEEEYVRFLNTTGNQLKGWIGLHKGPDAAIYEQWSDGSPVTYISLAEILKASYDQCVFYKRDLASWVVGDCSKVLGPFFCYRLPDLILVKENKSWEEALDYCRENYTDLASLSSKNDFLKADKTLNGTTGNIWTSLRFLGGVWFWANRETLDNHTFSSCPISPDRCGARNFTANRWQIRSCDEKLYFLCYTEKVSSVVPNTYLIPRTDNAQ